MTSPARSIAAAVLERVWRDDAWAAPSLDAELSRRPRLDRRDRALATELVYGVLRTSGALEQTLARFAKGNRWTKKALVKAHILMAAYELSFLDRVPDFAAVSEAVGAIKKDHGRQLAGFANAVLRKLAKATECGEPAARRQAIIASVPNWLRDAVCLALGDQQQADAFFAAAELAPPICLRLVRGQGRQEWIDRLAEAAPAATVSAAELSDRCIVLRDAGAPSELPGAGEAWVVQEQGAQLIARAVGASSADQVLDACAGRGGKTLLMAEQLLDGGAIDAADLHPAKLAKLRAAHPPASLRHVHAVDWTRGSGELAGQRYDRVLVDAPCTGVGTLRRRPEIAERLSASDPDRMATLQLQITRAAAQHLRPGGRLIYAVCSLLETECEKVIEALTRTGLEPCAFDSAIGQQLAGEACAFRLLPQLHGTDGYFVASLRAR